MSQALTKYLKDFSQFVPAEETAASASADFPETSFESDWLAEPEVTVDLEDEKRKAFAEGEEAARRQASEVLEAELESLRSLHREEMEQMKTRYEEEIAGHLATSVLSMKQMISQHVEAVCLRLFATLVEQEFAQKAAVDLATQVVREIEGGFAGTIRVLGPDPLISTMREKLRDVENSVDYVVTDEIDVQVQMDSSVLMTRLAEFFQNVRGLAGE